MTATNSLLRAIVTVGMLAAMTPAASAQGLVASVLPSSRSVQVGGAPATVFATMINTSATTARDCTIGPPAGLAAGFRFQRTDPATNLVVGAPDTPVDIAPGASQSFVLAIEPSAEIAPTDLVLSFRCQNPGTATPIPGVNTMLLSASTTPTPDVVALAATLNNDGVASVRGRTGPGAFAVATVNVGASGFITAAPDTGEAQLPLLLSICPTDPATGTCLTPPGPSAGTFIDASATPTFAVFLGGTDTIPLDPARHRVFVRFRDAGGVVRGATSVAVRTVDDLRGTYNGLGFLSQTGCSNPGDDGTFEMSATLTIRTQTGERIEGDTSVTSAIGGEGFQADATFSGGITVGGTIQGTLTYVAMRNAQVTSRGSGTFTGRADAAGVDFTFDGRASEGDTCRFSGTLEATQ
jgi:hypothetical protein